MAQTKSDPTHLMLLALAHTEESGWNQRMWDAAEKANGLPAGLYRAAFPEGMGQFAATFHAWLDARMLHTLETDAAFETAKVREKIFAAVMARLDALLDYREAMRAFFAHQMLPWNTPVGMRDLARAADAMWKAAGDRSIDYNYYTKRTLLAGVYASTLNVWLNDSSAGQAETKAFLRARIEDVLKVGKAIGGLKDKFKGKKAA
jgi:ubiquinone biosynthesis protein COQ9